ncbi:MAG: hypothetical protein Q9194_003930 [Teloschistes cf. exilis]
MTEDDVYRTSTQYRLWSFTPESLTSLRGTTNATAAEGVKAAVQSLKAVTEHQDPSQDGYAAMSPEVDCLTIEEEQRIVSYYCLQTLNFVDFCEYPTNVKATAVQYLKRFYLTNSPMTYHPKEIMPTAVYLAMKSEDNFHYVKSFAEKLDNITTEDILAPEFLLTQGLRFTFDVRHPFHGLEGGFMELLAYANGKGQGGPLVNMSPKEIRDVMLGLAPPPGSSTKASNVKELLARIQGAHGKAKETLKTSALLTDVYFLFTPSQIWLSTLLLVDPPLARFYLETKIPATSDLNVRLLTILQKCADTLRSSPAAQPGKEEKRELKRIDKKLAQCRNPQKMDLVGMNKAQKRDPEQNGGTGIDDKVAKRRRLERERIIIITDAKADWKRNTLSVTTMAKPDATRAKAVDDLDDMLYPSDEEETKMAAVNSEETVKPPVDVKPGMVAEVKNLYPSEEDDHGRFTMTDKPPVDMPEPEETDETARYALLIRNRFTYGKNRGLSISSIVVQSPLLKNVLRWVLKDYPCMAPELDRLEVVAPYRPFIHRWDRLTHALNNERDPETKSHIQLFYDALKEELALNLEARDDFVNHKTITFNSLWYIFEPGTIVFTTLNKRHIAAKLKNTSIYAGRHEDVLQLDCEMIYANGDELGWGQHRFEIPDFGGMQKIYDLPVFPLKYHRKVEKITKDLIENGKKYEQLTGLHHKQYQGVALDGYQPFYVDSRVVIDAKAFMCYNPDRDMVLRPLKRSKGDDSYDHAILDGDSESPISSSDEDDSSSAYLSTKVKKPQSWHALTDGERMLCGTSVKGYSLRNKRWLDFFVDSIQDIDWKLNAWDDVVLKEDQKDLIFSMTDGHRSNHQGLQSQGLNILLSGPTGVGKTFAVESLAEHLRAPLFHVTPADVDLDTKNPDLESPFTDMLEMCGKWNAILLCDEENKTFDSDDLDNDEGNDSLLLRALESHSNVFFVTCNRRAEDCMDDRLQSRFHVCLELSELTAATRGQIWQKCLESHKDVKFFDNFTTLGQWTLNGREIANAVTAAKTLTNGGTMEMKHLERVVPLEKQTVTIEADTSHCFKPKEKIKKSKKTVTDLELPPTPPPPPPAEVREPTEPVLTENDEGFCGWSFTKPKKSEKKVALVEVNALPEAELMPLAVEEPKLVVEPAPKTYENLDEDWGTFGLKKDKKKKKKEVKTVEVTEELQPASVPEEIAEVTDGVAPVVGGDDLVWGAFTPSKNKKKSKKTSENAFVFDDIPEPPVEDVTKGDDVDDLWGGWGKKSKAPEPKSSTNKEAEADAAHNDELAPPPPPPAAEIDDWGFWTSSAKSKKKKGKKGAVDWETAPVEANQPELPDRKLDAPLVANSGCQTCAAIEPNIGHIGVLSPHASSCPRLESSQSISPGAPLKSSLFSGTKKTLLIVPTFAMVSASKAARQAKRAEEGKDKKKTVASKISSKAASQNASTASSVNGDETPPMMDGDGDALPDDEQPATTDEKMSTVKKLTDQMDKHGLSDRVTTGVLASLAQSRDVKITSASLVFHGKVLITDTTLELNYGRRYGLLGENGCGKSTLLKAIDKREYPVPDHVDIYLLNEGAPPSELGALEWVVKEAENEMERLDKLAEDILERNGPEDPILEDLYERMETMDPSTFQTRASLILTGLGFNKKTIHKKTKDMSGGWRMRVALAKALFVKPSLLLLDDPTAHLDLEACVWLEEYLKKWDRTLVLVSHSMDFLNGVCTNMIDMRMKQLIYYGGNYDTYIKTRTEQETNQMKAYAKQQEEIQHIKKFIASAGTYANLVRQAKSRQKILDKMEADGFIQPVHQDRVFTFRFADVEKLPPPVLSFDDVTFGYSGKPQDHLYENLDLGVDMDSRTALVGPNGVGKSTLLRLMTGKLSTVSGTVARHTHLKLGLYSQHSAEQLDLTKSALDFVRDKYSEKSQDYQYWRQQLGRYGLSGESQTALMGTLSEGQKSRIVFALLAIDGPNMLLLDEPTNGLDIPTIDSLADAINAFSGGVVVVSHDFRLLDKIAKDIMVCEHKTVKRWDGSIGEYKNHLRKKMVTMGQV